MERKPATNRDAYLPIPGCRATRGAVSGNRVVKGAMGRRRIALLQPGIGAASKPTVASPSLAEPVGCPTRLRQFACNPLENLGTGEAGNVSRNRFPATSSIGSGHG